MHSSMPTLFNRLGSIAWLTETDREDFSSPSSRSDDANLGKMSSTNLAMRSVTQEIKKLPGGYVEFVVIDWQAAFCRTILFLAGVYICLRRSLSLYNCVTSTLRRLQLSEQRNEVKYVSTCREDVIFLFSPSSGVIICSRKSWLHNIVWLIEQRREPTPLRRTVVFIEQRWQEAFVAILFAARSLL